MRLARCTARSGGERHEPVPENLLRGRRADLVRSATVVLLLLALASAGNEARAESAS